MDSGQLSQVDTADSQMTEPALDSTVGWRQPGLGSRLPVPESEEALDTLAEPAVGMVAEPADWAEMIGRAVDRFVDSLGRLDSLLLMVALAHRSS